MAIESVIPHAAWAAFEIAATVKRGSVCPSSLLGPQVLHAFCSMPSPRWMPRLVVLVGGGQARIQHDYIYIFIIIIYYILYIIYMQWYMIYVPWSKYGWEWLHMASWRVILTLDVIFAISYSWKWLYNIICHCQWFMDLSFITILFDRSYSMFFHAHVHNISIEIIYEIISHVNIIPKIDHLFFP